MRCGGCAAKVPAECCGRVMARLAPGDERRGDDRARSPDDAAVISFPGGPPLLQTVDFFRAMVDDPYLFGRIAATHALGDIYAMGGVPETALAIATLPPARPPIVEHDLFHMLKGGLEVLEAAGAVLVGGHSAEGAELALGFAVTGRTRPGRLLRKGGLQARRPADPDQAARHRRDPRRARCAGWPRRGWSRARSRRCCNPPAAASACLAAHRRHRLHRCDRVRPARPSPRNAARLRNGRGSTPRRSRRSTARCRCSPAASPARCTPTISRRWLRSPATELRIPACRTADRSADRRRAARRCPGRSRRWLPRRVAQARLPRRADRGRRRRLSGGAPRVRLEPVACAAGSANRSPRMSAERAPGPMQRSPRSTGSCASEEAGALIARYGRARSSTRSRGAGRAAQAALPPPWMQSSTTSAASLARLMQPSQRRVFNLTGTVLHTNLGRAPLPEEAIEAAVRGDARADDARIRHSRAGKRGERDDHVAGWLTRLTGAEAALAVNNNAGALVLALNALADGRETIVSRGELIEIGGSFRLPDIMARAGTTAARGRHHQPHASADFAAAIGPQTGLILKVHTSNYADPGLHRRSADAEARRAGARARLPVCRGSRQRHPGRSRGLGICRTSRPSPRR